MLFCMETFFILITVYLGTNDTHGFSFGSDEMTRTWTTRERCEQSMLQIVELPKGDKLVKSVDGHNAVIFIRDGEAIGAAHCLEIKY